MAVDQQILSPGLLLTCVGLDLRSTAGVVQPSYTQPSQPDPSSRPGAGRRSRMGMSPSKHGNEQLLSRKSGGGQGGEFSSPVSPHFFCSFLALAKVWMQRVLPSVGKRDGSSSFPEGKLVKDCQHPRTKP